MRRSLPRQLVALFAVLALVLATTAYESHIHGAGGKINPSAHCDLCLQFTGTAGASTLPVPLSRPMLVVARIPRAHGTDDAVSHYQSRSHRSRAPPPHHVI
jgi:type IV secretory pathway protease TraF